MSSDLLSHARRVHSEKGTIQLVKEGSKFGIERISWRIALWQRIVASMYDNLLSVHNRKSLKQNADEIYTYSRPETIEINDPIYFRDLPKEISHIIGTHKFNQPFISQINNAQLMKETGISLTSDQSIILDSISSRRDNLEKRLIREPKMLFELVYMQKRKPKNNFTHYDYKIATPLRTGPFPRSDAPGFASWTRYQLAQLEGIETYIEETGNVPTILLRPSIPESCIESLEEFGYNEDKIELWDPADRVRIKHLVVPTVRRNERLVPYYRHRLTRKTDRWYNSVSPSAFEWLETTARERIPEAYESSVYSEKIYISRRDARKRRVLNEESLVEALDERGFESYSLSDLSFAEQVELFGNADQIVAPHGAGLANLVFASDCDVVEMFGTKIRPTFFMLAKKKGLKYGIVSGEPDADYQNMTIDPSKVIKMLEYLSDGE